ncbi:hypothetical protein ACOSZF_10130 [Cytobacillus firmus]|uniref:Hydrolase n=1 Tax=Cytobacillus firmus TaxID=1399 RepID=A0A380XI09_CYTFI|nr:hypothetical protein [Cytobacillus firmus]KAF0821842.1 hydrolase [Cytobacillus firmus]MDD9313402.1 hypothetical protein [Cytobacillus firmus]MEC1894880.1 hypothetical protein [Cytobacillus firmus]MED1907600.1 hypothetical protein [Cytobacillus firmus]MED1942640.1 hypothetical protein [Cytobacillus firmus]
MRIEFGGDELEDFAKGIGTTDDILFNYIDDKLGIKVNRKSIQEKTERAFQSQRDILMLRDGIQAGMHCVAVPNDVTHFLSFHEKVMRYKAFSEIPMDELIMGQSIR